MIDKERPFVTARAAAQLLGVPEVDVIDDVQEGCDGALPALNGGRFGAAWVVYAYEVAGDRLAMHRKRLAPDSSAEYAQDGRLSSKAGAVTD